MANIIKGTGSQFFADQQVQAEDLNNIQYTTIQTFRNYLKSITKTPGVYLNTYSSTALQVTCNPGGTLISISPGTGVDTQGQVIEVPTTPTTVSGSIGTDPLYYPARPARTLITPIITGSGTYYVNLYHDMIYSFAEPNDSGITHYTRAYDSYRIAVEDSLTTTGIPLAYANFNASGSIAQTTDSTGYLAGDGIRYSLFDNRAGYQVYDRQKEVTADAVTLLNTAVFEEELEKSVGFVFPADGHSMFTKIHRNVTFVRMEVYLETQANEAGTCTFDFFVSSTPGVWPTSSGTLTISATASELYKFATQDINIPYTARHSIKFQLTRADDAVTRATVTLVYKRR